MSPPKRPPSPLSYRVFPGGSGTLLLLHGMSSNHAYFARPLRGAGGFRLLLPDLLGHGDSLKPEGTYALEEHLAPLRDLLRGEAPGGPLVLGGHSMGAALAVALAGALPEGSVRGLLLFNLPWFTSALELHGVLREGSEAYRRATAGIEVRREEDLLRIGTEALRAAGNALPQGLRDASRAPSDAALRGTGYHLLYRFRLSSHAAVLGKVPSLCLLGSEDRVAPARLALRHLRALPAARAALLEGAGHHLLHTHADLARGLAATFLESLGTGGASTPPKARRSATSPGTAGRMPAL